jgi:hypothetical protein
MRKQVQPIFKFSFVEIVVAAILVLAALPGRVTAQQNNAAASSAVPQIIQFSGIVKDGAAAVPSGTVSITFTLYENEQGGTALWSETDNVQVDAQGHYTALLGSASPQGLPLSLFTTVQAHWLAVQPLLQGLGEQPRVLLVSAPYALKAGDAETVGGLLPSAFVRTDASSGTSETTTVTNTATQGSAPPLGTVSSFGTPPAKPRPPLQQYYNASVGYKIGGNAVLTEPGGPTDANIAVGYQALLSNTTGNDNTASGAYTLNSNTTGSNNTANGFEALRSNTTGSHNTANGSQALFNNTTGDTNTASGFQALSNNATGSENTANGVQALYSNTLGILNTASGFQALSSNTTGSYNAASGAYALYRNTTGASNTASGFQTLMENTTGGNNTAYGLQALDFNTTGSNNTASGEDALFSNTTGSTNTANGYFALPFNSTGSNNIAIGYRAAANVSGGNSNNIEVGSTGSSGDSGTVRIGCTSTAQCAGGFGTEQTSFFVAGVRGVITGQNNAVPVLIDSNGQLGTVSSSRRYKEDIRAMGGASEGLMRLRPVTFRYKKPFDDGSKPIQYGLIAEEVAEVYPDLVARSADGQIETVKYQLLDPMLLNEVQRQQAEINGLQERLKAQQAVALEQQNQLKTQQTQMRELASQMKIVQASLRTRRGNGHARLASAKGTTAPIATVTSVPADPTVRGGN